MFKKIDKWFSEGLNDTQITPTTSKLRFAPKRERLRQKSKLTALQDLAYAHLTSAVFI